MKRVETVINGDLFWNSSAPSNLCMVEGLDSWRPRFLLTFSRKVKLLKKIFSLSASLSKVSLMIPWSLREAFWTWPANNNIELFYFCFLVLSNLLFIFILLYFLCLSYCIIFYFIRYTYMPVFWWETERGGIQMEGNVEELEGVEGG